MKLVLALLLAFTLISCGQNPEDSETATAPLTKRIVILSGAANLRTLNNSILEVVVQVPTGSEIEVVSGVAPVFYDYRDSDGSVKRSSNGFYPNLQLKSVPASEQENFPPDMIEEINRTPAGLFMSSLDLNSGLENDGTIPALSNEGEPDERYLKYFSPSGKRLRNNYSNYHKKRFGDQLNREIPLSSLPSNEQRKWLAIYQELVGISDRTRETSRKNLFIDSGSSSQDVELAKRYSIQFENNGTIQKYGAWSIAVLGTASRHGFENVPCAEFVSEMIRQAYTKAGYQMADDFKGKNYLLWSNTAAVVNLASALFSAGWIPWDPYLYKPKTGAIGMHAQATTPGHTYMIAGENGRFIVDNGSPKGRDLFRTSNYQKDIIGLMYDHGVFFLPPGIIPERW